MVNKSQQDIHKRIEKGLKEMGKEKRTKKLGLIPGVDSPYQWVPVGDTHGTTKEAF